MKVQDYAQMIGYLTRDKTTDVPGSMAHELRMASAESDAVKDMINKQYGPGTMKYGSEIPQPSQRPDVIEIDAINSFMKRNPAADGGVIGKPGGVVEPGVMYYGKNVRVDAGKSRNQYGEVNLDSKAKKITKAVNRYNKLLTDGLAKKDISKIPSFQGWFIKNYPEMNAGNANKYINDGRVKVKPLIRDKVKFDFVQQLVDEANAKNKHTKWIDIESKVTNFEGRKTQRRADTGQYRKYIDQLDTIEDKYNKAFQNILDNPDEPLNLKFKKYSSGSGVDRTSFLKKYLYEQVQAGTTANIKKALDKNPFYSKNKNLIEKYAFYSGTVGGEGRSFQGKTFNEALQFGKDNIGGRVIFSGSGKTKGPAEDIYNFALRSWDTSNRQQIPLSDQKVIFYDKKTNKPIKWGDVPRGKDNFKKLKINDVYFKYKEDPKNTKWDIETVRGKGKTSGLFDEVYDSFKAYQTLVNTKVDNPFGKGKVKLSDVIENVAEKGYGKTSGAYGLAKDHQLGVVNEPFKKIRLLPQRLNLTLRQIEGIKGSDKFKRNLTNELLQEFKGLKGAKFNQAVQNNILNIAEEINKGFSTTESGYRELGKKIASDPKKLAMYSPAEQVYIKQIAGEINPYKATQMLAAFPKGPKLATKYIPVLQKIFKTGGAKGKAAARALQIIAAGGLGYKMEDILKGTGLKDKEYELIASAGDAPLVEKGLSTGEKVAAGTAAGLGLGTKTGRKILGNTLSAAGLPLSVALNTAIGIDPTSAVDRTILAGEAALAPAVIKDAIRVTDKIKNPLLRKVAQGITTINPKYALKAARALSPIGIASLAGEGLYQVGKLGYEDQKRFDALSPKEQAAERAKQEAFAFDITGA